MNIYSINVNKSQIKINLFKMINTVLTAPDYYIIVNFNIFNIYIY